MTSVTYTVVQARPALDVVRATSAKFDLHVDDMKFDTQ